jgi:hypothetical protein
MAASTGKPGDLIAALTTALSEDEHIARMSPEHAELPRRVEAQRTLLDRHQPYTAPDGTFCAWHSGEHRVPWPCSDVRGLADYMEVDHGGDSDQTTTQPPSR